MNLTAENGNLRLAKPIPGARIEYDVDGRPSVIGIISNINAVMQHFYYHGKKLWSGSDEIVVCACRVLIEADGEERCISDKISRSIPVIVMGWL